MSHEDNEFPLVDKPKDFGELRNHGSIMQWKNDVYGNQYALFKLNAKVKGLGGIGDSQFGGAGGLLGINEDDDSRNTNDFDQNNRDPDSQQETGFIDEDGCFVPGQATNCLILDGHIFNDPRSGGTNFDYSVVEQNYNNFYWESRGLDSAITTNRSGLTSRTVETLTDFLTALSEFSVLNEFINNNTINGTPAFWVPGTLSISPVGDPFGAVPPILVMRPYSWCVDLHGTIGQECDFFDGVYG